MAEFQKKKAQEELLAVLRNMGLEVSPEVRRSTDIRTAIGPGETAPAAYGGIANLGPDYLPPAPVEPVPTLPLEPPEED